MRPVLLVCLCALVLAPTRLGGQATGRVSGSPPAWLTKPRISPLSEAGWSDEQRALVATYSRDGRVGNDLKTFLIHPELVKGVMSLLNYLAGESTLLHGTASS